MSTLTEFNVQQLIEQWYQMEKDGVEFPVDFEIAWKIAGYSAKDKGKRKFTNKSSLFVLNEDYVTQTGEWSQGGRSGDSIRMSCDTFKHFCLMAQTEQGRQIRQYFIECEKKWKLVEKHHPKIAEDIELIRMREEHAILDKRIELARLEKEKEQAIFNAQSFRYTITQTCPEHIQQKVLGYTEVKTVEYRDRIIKDDNVINDGSTVNKTWLCKRFGLMRKGKADTKRLNAYLAEMPSEAFELSAYIRENEEFKREYLPLLEQVIERQRQLGLGEQTKF